MKPSATRSPLPAPTPDPAGAAERAFPRGAMAGTLQENPAVPGGSSLPFARFGDATSLRLVLTFVGLAVGIVAAGTFYYQSIERKFRLGVESNLSSIADLKVNELAHWRKERLADGNVLFRNSAFSALVRRCLAPPADAEARLQLLDWLGKYLGAYGYDQVWLMDARGNRRFSVPEEGSPASPLALAAAAAALRSGEVSLHDLYRHEGDGRVYLQVTIPLRDERDADRPLGTVNLRIDAADYLFPFIQKWPVSARTAETMLVRRAGNAVLYLNDLRFRPNSALQMQAQLAQRDRPAARAVLGETGIVEGLDYRGVPVVAALRGIPDSPWFLVAKLDQAEAYEPIRGQLWQISVTVGIFLAAAASGVGLTWWQARLKFYREQVGAANVVRETGQLLAETQAMASLGGYVLDLASGHWSCTEALDAVFGVDQSWEHSLTNWLALVHPEDRAMMADYLSREVIGRRQPFNKEYRIIRHADRAERWVQGLGTLQLSPEGQPVRMRGSIQDITERKLAEAALQESEAKFKGIFEHSNVAKSLTRVSGELQVNQAFCDLLGYSAEELRHRSWQSITPAEDVDLTLRVVERLLNGQQNSIRFTKRYRHKNGSMIWGDVSTTLRRDAAGRPLYFMTAVIDITASKQAEARIADQLAELRHWHEVTIGREGRVLEVKREVNALLAERGQPPRYPSAEDPPPPELETDVPSEPEPSPP